MTSTLGLGLVGYGGFGAFTAEVYAEMPEVRIVAVTDADAKRCEAAAARYQVRAYSDLAQLLGDPQVDLVAIATPPWLHASQAIAAAGAGKHIFLEKPLATTLEEADALVECVQAQGVKLSIDYVLRRVPLYVTLNKLVQSGLLGAITYVRLENTASNEALHAGHWFWDRALSGGIFIEHGVHFFDLCTQLCQSRPSSVSGYARHIDGRQDRVMAAVSYSNNVLASFYHAFDRAAILERTELRVVLEQGSITISGWIPDRLELTGSLPVHEYAKLAELLGVELEVRDVPAPVGISGATAGQLVHAVLTRPDRDADYREAVRAGMADLVRAIQQPEYTPEVTPRDAYESFRLAFAAQRAILEGHSVTM